MSCFPYPLRTKPFFRDYLWGGRKLQTVLRKPLPADGTWAESWEVIDHPEHRSKIINGAYAGQTVHDLASAVPSWLFGAKFQHLTSLPLLFKFLDCQRVLSVQVHPDDKYAQSMSPPDWGKTEAWYVLAAEPNSKLYAGLQSGVTADELRDAITEGTLEKLLHEIQPSPGDCILIPSGTVHALGAGLLVAEIQQSSNTTFRLFDWNRVDARGQPRELHIEQALEVIDFTSGPRVLAQPHPTPQAGRERLIECDKFVLDRLTPSKNTTLAGDDRFHLLTAPYGGITLSWQFGPANQARSESVGVGDTLILPGEMPPTVVEFSENCHAAKPVLLDMYLPTA